MMTAPAPILWQDYSGELRNPFLIVGFQGWSDAGAVSSDTLQHLTEVFRPQRLATISYEPFLNFTLERPVAQVENGIIHDIEPMFAEIVLWNNPDGDHDVAMMLGKEPHHAWLTFSATVAEVMRKLEVKQLFTIGGVQDTVSHKARPTVSIVGSTPEVVDRALELDEDLSAAEYYGPISIHSFLVKECAALGIPALSLWGHAPAYLQKNPRLVARIVSILGEAMGFLCPVDTLKQKAVELDRRISEAMTRDPNLKKLVESIHEKERSQTLSSGDEKIIRLNDFVRRDPSKDGDRS